MNKAEFLFQKKKYLKELKEGKVCVYPTDTIYGIGCDATNYDAVAKIRVIKKRQKTPLSIIIPDKSWIYNNCEVDPKFTKYIEKLPGPYTLILKLNDSSDLAANVNCGTGTIGVRIPNHWFSEVVSELKKPFITTSVNYHGDRHIKLINEIPFEMKPLIDIIVDDGLCDGNPSTIINLTKDKVDIKERG